MIPVSEPNLSKEELKNVIDCVKSNWISSSGKYLTEFEDKFARYHDVNHAVALSNGTAALEVALHAIGIKEGDEVIIPSFTIISVALAVIRVGAIPRFADVDKDTWNIDPEYINELITTKTKAIIAVHSFGHPVDVDAILDIARSNNLKVIEDTAEAIASKYKGSLCGTFGDVATFSLYANKLVTTGEGGIIITDNDEIASRARRYINLYFGTEERFSHEGLGFNFRMTNLQAAIGVAQIDKINQHAKKKLEIGSWYKKALEDSEYFQFQKSIGDIDHIYWMYTIIISDELDIEGHELLSMLKERKIESRQLFKGLHLQEPLKKYVLDDQKELPITEKLYKKGLYLPSAVNLKEKDVKYIVDSINDIAICLKKK